SGIAAVGGDGTAGIAPAEAAGRDVPLPPGAGRGQSAAPVAHAIAVDAEPFGIALGDADGDGHVDILTANPGSDGTVFPPPELPGTISLLAGDGAGGFAAAVSLALGGGEGRAHAVALGDVTGDGHADIVAS